MSITRVYEYDGYAVGDRLLEGVIFQCIMSVTDDTLRLESIGPRGDMMHYLSSIKWEAMIPAMRKDIQARIDHTLAWCKSENLSLLEELKKFEAETGLPGIQILDEV